MLRITGILGLSLFMMSCSHEERSSTCPALSTVVPPTMDVKLVAGLTARFAGPDRANSISEAIAQIHRAAPLLDADEITNILIVADCPNAAAAGPDDDAAMRRRIGVFRAQVVTLLGNQPAN